MAEIQPEDQETPQIVNLSQSDVETVQAGMVRANQASIRHINAEEVDLQTSITLEVSTGDLHANDSILGIVNSENASANNSIAASLHANSLTFDGSAVSIVANSVTGREIRSAAVVGTGVQADNIQTGLLISREVHGNVVTTMDDRMALMTGAVAGAVIGLILLAGKLLFGRKD